MAKRRKNREINVFGVSFMDVLSNTVGGLAFILILAFLLMGQRQEFKKTQILTITLPDVHASKPYDLFLSAKGGGGTHSWALTDGLMPEGLEFNDQTGRISGIVKREQTFLRPDIFEFSVSCEGADKRPVTRLFKMTLHPEEQDPAVPVKIVSGSDLPPALTTEYYPLALSCTGGIPPYSWKIEEGNLPQGMTLDKTGNIVGATDHTGSFSFTVSVSAGHKDKPTIDSKTFNLKIIKKIPPPPPPPPLIILTDSLSDALVEHKFSLFPAAEGGSPPYQWRIVSGKPAWFKTDSEKKAFYGKPLHKDVGDCGIILEVIDSKGLSKRTDRLTFKIVPPGVVPEPLKLLTDMLPVATVEKPFSFFPAAKGGYTPLEWTCQGIDKFPGLKFDSATGRVYGTPKSMDSGSLSFSVSDTSGKSDSVKLDMKISAPKTPLKLISSSVPLGLTETPYYVTLSATGGHPPYKWDIAKGKLPGGLQLLPKSGEIKGTPEQPGDYTFLPRVTDAHGTSKTAEQNILFRIWSRQQRPKLVMKTTSLPMMVQGETFSMALSAEGGLPPYRWTVKGNLPEGLGCVDGEISGKPIKSGTYPLVIDLTDAEGQHAQADIQLTVKKLWPWWWVLIALIAALIFILLALRALRRPPLTKVRIVTDKIPNARASCEYSVQLACEGGCAPYKWKLISGDLPPGLELTEKGLIAGTPFAETKVNETIETRFKVEIVDARGQKDRKQL